MPCSFIIDLDTVKELDHNYTFKRDATRNDHSLMTYILGCRCSDGAVLVAGKKIINIEDGAESKYSNKLFSDL